VTRWVGVAGAVAVLLAGCAMVQDDDIRLPPAGAGFDYQLGGSYDLPDGVTVVARDSTDEPAAGAYSICYVNGFQTQPGDGARWVSADLALRDADGQPFIDPGWPDEYLLDTSTRDNREAIVGLMRPVFDRCATAGFDAVEVDNLDTYSRSGGALTLDDNMALASAYAEIAHSLGMAIAQKNGAGSSAELRDAVGFDFAVTEECARYDECADYGDAYGDLVFDIEYSAEFLDAACTVVGSAILRDRDLAPPGDPGHVFEAC
jgi:hypothetical protein